MFMRYRKSGSTSSTNALPITCSSPHTVVPDRLSLNQALIVVQRSFDESLVQSFDKTHTTEIEM